MKTSESIDKIIPALAAARSEMAFVTKGGNNTFDKYLYAKLENYVDASKDALLKNGIVVISSVDKVEQLDNRQTKNGNTEYVVRIIMTMTAAHVSGQWCQVVAVGDGQDRGDKAIYKANTGATKYGYARLFGLVTGDDSEENEPTTASPQRSVPPAPAPTQSNAKQSFAAAVTEWTGMVGNDMGQAAKEIAAANGINLASATDAMYSALLTYTANQIEQGVKFTEWSAANKKPAASAVKVKG